MAKKKKDEQELSYLQMPLPQGVRRQRMTKLNWGGLNKRQTLDTGFMSMEKNISSAEFPYITPSQVRETAFTLTKTIPLFLYGYEDSLVAVYWEAGTENKEVGNVKVWYRHFSTTEADNKEVIGDLKEGVKKKDVENEPQRCIVKFNVYDNPTDVVGGVFTEKLLIFPDKYSMNANLEDIKAKGLALASFDPTGKLLPDMDYATVHLSRLFTVSKGKIFASRFNDYSNFNLDTAAEYNEANAWGSQTQANAKADGDFVGITAFQNHVICFKEDFMHEIYNNKNPFRVQDIYADGCIDNRSIQDVGGRLFFVSRDGVKIYTGGKPKDIGRDLNIDRFDKAVAGSDGRNYYLYCESGLNKYFFVFDTVSGQWSEEEVKEEVVAFARNKNGLYALFSDGKIYKLDSGKYSVEYDEHEWAFETDFITAKTIDIKHIQKIQLYAKAADNSSFQVHLIKNGEPEDKGQLVYDSKGRIGFLPIRVLVRKSAAYGFKLRFSGKGYVRFYEMEVDLTGGGELYV